MSTQPTYQLETEANEPLGVSEQVQRNRVAVDHAANAVLAQATHPSRWQRQGPLRRLVRRDPG
jgi:hypothetical protein